jgi:hypothetical protein
MARIPGTIAPESGHAACPEASGAPRLLQVHQKGGVARQAVELGDHQHGVAQAAWRGCGVASLQPAKPPKDRQDDRRAGDPPAN